MPLDIIKKHCSTNVMNELFKVFITFVGGFGMQRGANHANVIINLICIIHVSWCTICMVQ